MALLAVLEVPATAGREASKEVPTFRVTTVYRREIGCPSAKGLARPRRIITRLPAKLSNLTGLLTPRQSTFGHWSYLHSIIVMG